MKNIHPYMYVTEDKTVEYPNGEKLRYIIYGAYNAMGLIGTEHNGIAILNESKVDVVCDNIGQGDSFAFNPSNISIPKRLKDKFETLVSLPFEEIKEFVNNHQRSRYSL